MPELSYSCFSGIFNLFGVAEIIYNNYYEPVGFISKGGNLHLDINVSDVPIENMDKIKNRAENQKKYFKARVEAMPSNVQYKVIVDYAHCCKMLQTEKIINSNSYIKLLAIIKDKKNNRGKIAYNA